MNIAQIESNLQKLNSDFSEETFIYNLLLAYGTPKASISRLQKGLNLSGTDGEIIWKKKLYYKIAGGTDVHETIELAKTDEKITKHDPRFIVVTDFETLLAIDRKTTDTLDIPILELAKHFDFFLPLAGMEKAQHQSENPADVKAAGQMARLYDEILKDNPIPTSSIQAAPEAVHSLNVFLSRLLFCFFAEDTGIFDDGIFTNSIASHTQSDGSDLQEYLEKLFEVLNMDRGTVRDKACLVSNELPAYLNSFPYVNGGLFRSKHPVPVFTRRSRQLMIECGSLQWRDINPDIFGSMIQAVITPEHRGGLGMHYTSVPNIMKVIEPLFLNDLYEEFDASTSSAATSSAATSSTLVNPVQTIKKLNALLLRIWKIKLFDPACGSGNFLIIAYKELRRLEMKIFKEIDRVNQFHSNQFSGISLANFYGIELDDFAHEVATLSLWLAEHQMNRDFFAAFGRTKPALPLKETGNIVHGNACRVDWELVCPKKEGDEIYVMGNPPYLGARNQDESQKQDMAIVFNAKEEYKDSDYILCWFLKGSRYIEGINSTFAFVTTSSISQGSQIAYFWPEIYQRGQEICFAHQPFKWANNAKDKAGVICVIIGVQNSKRGFKKLFTSTLLRLVENITPYLTEGKSIIVKEIKKPLNSLPLMVMGTMARDGGNLILSEAEKNDLCNKYPETNRFLKRFLGADEYIKGKIRYCLWIEDNDLEFAVTFPEIKDRIDCVKKFRLESVAKTTNQYSKISHKLAQRSHQKGSSIIVPSVSSERREYIPMGFLDDYTVINNLALAVYNVEPWIFSLLTSKMHMCWVHSVGGYLGTSIRYSISICYNTFPFPPISEAQKQELEKYVYRILEERERHSEKTLAQLYDPDKMPDGLREAHRQNDLAVERCYRSRPFESDEERLEYLFKLYEQMIEEEKSKGTLFEKKKKKS